MLIVREIIGLSKISVKNKLVGVTDKDTKMFNRKIVDRVIVINWSLIVSRIVERVSNITTCEEI